MATVRNASPVTQTIPSLGLVVPAGETFEAPADVAAELVERPDFERASAPRKRQAKKAQARKKAPAKKPSAAPADDKTAAPADDPKES